MKLEVYYAVLFMFIFPRVWNFDKRTKEGNPTVACSIPALIPGGRRSTVVAISAHENMNLIAVGFKDGTVVLIRGNITRDRQFRSKVVHEETPGSSITGTDIGEG